MPYNVQSGNEFRKSKHTRAVIDACIPFRRKRTFPVIARSSQALDARIKAKWAADLPKGV